MSVRTANSEFSFHLPKLSYIDAKWEEPDLWAHAEAARPARKTDLFNWLSRRMQAIAAWRRDRRAIAELAAMSDYELKDIGVSRSDLLRAFDPAWSRDLAQRGG